MAALSSILGSPKTVHYSPKRNSNPPSYPPQQYQAQQQHIQQAQPRPYQKNEGGKVKEINLPFKFFY